MSDFNWDKSEKHPPPSVLLLHLERELGSRESAAVERHMAECWECRAESDHLQRGICGFIGYRKRVLLPSVPPPPPRNRLHNRPDGKTSDPVSWIGATRAAWRGFKSWRLVVAVTAMLATLLAVMIAPRTLLPPLGGPSSVSAAEFLRQAQRSKDPVARSPRTVVHQTLEIRHGGRRFKREIIRGKEGKPVSADGLPSNLPRLPPVDWSDPLGADQFVAWHDSLPAKADAVKEATGTVTLTTTPLQPGDIVSASLTVRSSDWHMIAKTVAVPNGPALEIREVAYELQFVPEPSSSLSSTPGGRPSPSDRPPVSMAEQPEWKMEEAELELREVLFRIGADVQEAPRIWRERGAVHVSAWVENESRARTFRQAVAAIPIVLADIHVPDAASPEAPDDSTAAPQTAMSPAFFVTRPPLTEQLWKMLGGMDSANQYLADLGTDYADLLAAASSLDRLARRYPEAASGGLPGPLQQRIENLASGRIASVQRLSRQYGDRLGPVLAEMLAQGGLAETAWNAPEECGQWRALAPAIAADLRNLQRTFRRLFVPERVEQPAGVSAAESLREADALRAGMMNKVRRLCVAGASVP